MTAPVGSPCINVCRMDEASGWCLGCLRTLHEIAGWAALADADKLRIWHALPQRREQWLASGRGPLPVAPKAMP